MTKLVNLVQTKLAQQFRFLDVVLYEDVTSSQVYEEVSIIPAVEHALSILSLWNIKQTFSECESNG